MENASKMPVMKIIHTIIGLVIMFSGHFLPNFSLVVPPDAKLAPMNLPAVDDGVLLSVTQTASSTCGPSWIPYGPAFSASWPSSSAAMLLQERYLPCSLATPWLS